MALPESNKGRAAGLSEADNLVIDSCGECAICERVKESADGMQIDHNKRFMAKCVVVALVDVAIIVDCAVAIIVDCAAAGLV
jgi:hypothetical protein